MDLSHIAGYLFVIGLVVAVIAGLAVGFANVGANIQAWLGVAFALIGVVIGACISTSKKIEEEIYVLVMVSLALLVASNMGVFASFNPATGAAASPAAGLGTAIDSIVGYIALFSAAAIIVLAIRTLTNFHLKKIS